MQTKTQLIMNVLFYGLLFLLPLTMLSLPEMWVEFSHLFNETKPKGKQRAAAIKGYKISGAVILVFIIVLLLLKSPGLKWI